MSTETSSTIVAGVICEDYETAEEIAERSTKDDFAIWTNGNMFSGEGVANVVGFCITYGDLYEISEVTVQDLEEAISKTKKELTKIGVEKDPKIYLVTNYG